MTELPDSIQKVLREVFFGAGGTDYKPGSVGDRLSKAILAELKVPCRHCEEVKRKALAMAAEFERLSPHADGSGYSECATTLRGLAADDGMVRPAPGRITPGRPGNIPWPAPPGMATEDGGFNIAGAAEHRVMKRVRMILEEVSEIEDGELPDALRERAGALLIDFDALKKL